MHRLLDAVFVLTIVAAMLVVGGQAALNALTYLAVVMARIANGG